MATSRGIVFQQQLGATIAGWMLADRPLDSRLNLGVARPIWLRFETEAPVDDILIATSEGGFVAIQAKTNLSLSSKPDSPFGKTVEQFVRHWITCRDGDRRLDWNRPLDITKDRLVLAVSVAAPSTIQTDLYEAILARRAPGNVALTQAQENAFALFELCVEQSWSRLTVDAFDRRILGELIHLIDILCIDPARVELSIALERITPDSNQARSVAVMLEQYCGQLMSRRGGTDMGSLRQYLISNGALLNAEPEYQADIQCLKAHTINVGNALERYETIDVGQSNGITVQRDCQPALLESAHNGSLLIIGEPGAGKSGVLNVLAKSLMDEQLDVLELAVDQHSVETLEGLSSELGLDHPLLEVLQAWDGPAPAWLIIDALDATRGGKGEGVFRKLIEQVLSQNSRWRVVASIRTFDLRMGQQFRALFKGRPPIPEFSESEFANVNHVHVPPWSPAELERLLERAPRLAEVIKSGSSSLQDLATVPFNTRLLGELVSDGKVTSDFVDVDSQAKLLRLYWDHRITQLGLPAEACLRRVVSKMVETRTLKVDRLDVAESAPDILEALSREGVLVSVEQNRLIQFRHHLLFDYAASKVFLSPDKLLKDVALFPKSEALGLMLAPALSFLLWELWVADVRHDCFWEAVSRLMSDEECDPVIRSIAGRVSVDLAVDIDDAQLFGERICSGNEAEGRALAHIVGALAVRFEDKENAPFVSWVKLVRILSNNVGPVAWSVRTLMYLLIDRVTEPERRVDLGVAARALLEHGLDCEEPQQEIVTSSIAFVAKTFDTDRERSRELLSRIFDASRFAEWGWDDVPALAREIKYVALADPDFAADIYRETYSRDVIEDRETTLGSSRILPLRSNARQDFDLARYSLSEADASAKAIALDIAYPYAGIEWNSGFLSTKHQNEMNAVLKQDMTYEKALDASTGKLATHMATDQATGIAVAATKPDEDAVAHTIKLLVIGKASQSDRNMLAQAIQKAAQSFSVPDNLSVKVTLDHLGGTSLPSRTTVAVTTFLIIVPIATEVDGDMTFSASAKVGAGKPIPLFMGKNAMEGMEAKETDHLVTIASYAILSRAVVTAYGQGWQKGSGY